MHSTPSHATEALKQVPFFAHLGQEEVAGLAERLIPRRFADGQIIFHLGDPGGLLYVISRGKVKISHSTPEGQEALLAILGVGDFFGELALLDDSPRSATAESIGNTETLTLHRDEFLRFLNNNPGFATHVLQTLARRIRNLNDQISDIFFLDLNGRLARTLLNLADRHGVVVEDGIKIEISLTQSDLADMTGATRVSVNKTLGRFRRARWVRTDGRRFVLTNPDALRNLIQMSGG